MSNENQNEYEVGYKKPPVSTRFKKGKSGNPGGKRKEVAEDLDPGKVLQTIDTAFSASRDCGNPPLRDSRRVPIQVDAYTYTWI
jgi:hypothetical protein